MFKSLVTKSKEERTESSSSISEITTMTASGSHTASVTNSIKTERLFEKHVTKIENSSNGSALGLPNPSTVTKDALPFSAKKLDYQPITNLYSSTTSATSPSTSFRNRPHTRSTSLPTSPLSPRPSFAGTTFRNSIFTNNNNVPSTNANNNNNNGSVAITPTTKPLKVVVKKSKKYYDGQSIIPTYSTHSKKRGKVLVINNIKFSGDKKHRHGAELDEKNIVSLFTQMGFKVKTHRDKTKKEMQDIFAKYVKKDSLKAIDINVVIVMSHGTGRERSDSTEVVGVDEELLSTTWILNQFDNESCKNLTGKPKIFIFQCCRGANINTVPIETDSVPFQLPVRKLSDMLVAYSTLPGYVSHRDPKTGSWYIQTICEVFMEHAHDIDVESMLKIVDSKLARLTTYNNSRQTSSFENKGFKSCYLHPM